MQNIENLISNGTKHRKITFYSSKLIRRYRTVSSQLQTSSFSVCLTPIVILGCILTGMHKLTLPGKILKVSKCQNLNNNTLLFVYFSCTTERFNIQIDLKGSLKYRKVGRNLWCSIL